MCRLPEKGRKETEEIAEEMKERDREERNRNESEETEEIKTSPPYPYLLQGQQALPNCKPISAGRPSDIRYMTPSHHPTTIVISTAMSVMVDDSGNGGSRWMCA